MDGKLAELYDDIVSGKMTCDDVKEYFNSYQCFMPKADFGKLIICLIGETDFDIVSEIIKSKKGKQYNDFVDDYGEPMIHVLILQSIFSTKFRFFKDKLFDLIDDEENGVVWNVVNNNFENILHVVCFLCNSFEKDDLIKFINMAKKHNISPLNRDGLNRNAIDVFKLKSNLGDIDKKEIIDLMESIGDESIIDMDSYLEFEEDEEEVVCSVEA